MSGTNKEENKMLFLNVFLTFISAYMAGAFAQGLSQVQYGWKKDVLVGFLMLLAFFFQVCVIGTVLTDK